MGLEQYAGMSSDEKVTVMLVKMENLENYIMTKPCPSQACLKCQSDVSDLKAFKVRVETAEAKEAEQEEKEETRGAWFWPLLITSVLASLALFFQIMAMV